MVTERAAGMARRMRPLLGTYVEVAAVDAVAPDACIEAAFAAIRAVHERLSFHEPDSELSRLNRSAGVQIRLSPLSQRVLRLARGLQIASGGLFNCTVGGALVQGGHLPDHGGGEVVSIGDASDLVFKGSTVRLSRPVRITLDGIAKGFAIDLATAALKRHGARAGWVNAGGDMRVFGDLTLPVARPDGQGGLEPLGGIRNAALATSRVTDFDDHSFHGRIVSQRGVAECGQWSVIARHAWRADALTKVAALARGHQRGELLARLGGREVDGAAQAH